MLSSLTKNGDPMGAEDIRRAEDVLLAVLEEAGAEPLRIADLIARVSERLKEPNAAIAAHRALWNLVNAGKIKLTASRRFRAAQPA